MKNKMLTVLLLLLCTTWTKAQNNPIFFGGSGDGFAGGGYQQPTNDLLIHHGGSGDGSAFAGYVQSFTNLFKGGNGDGYVFATSGIPTTDKIFFGGNADGVTSASSGIPAVDKIFFGGTADGIAFATSGSPNVDKVFFGGPGDGWSSTYFLINPLPLNLLSFSGIQKDSRHLLSWETVQEKETDYFILERSATGNSFDGLGQIKAFGSNEATQQYNYTDELPLNGNNFYRLKMVDIDGKFTFSNIVLLRLLKHDAILKVYPNPAASVLNIELSGKNDGGEVLIDIYDGAARLLRHKTLRKDSNAFSIDIQSLASGVYTIRIIDQEEINTVKFIKQ